MAMSADHRSKFAAFTGNVDVFNLGGTINPKQTNKKHPPPFVCKNFKIRLSMDCRPVLKANCNAAYLYYASFLSKDKQKSMINPCKPDFFLPSLVNFDHNSKHCE